MPGQQGIAPEQMMQMAQARRAQLAGALGLHPEFVADVAARGADAVFDRAQMSDQTGAMARMLQMAQQLGTYLQDEAETGGDTRMGVILDVAGAISRYHGLREDVGLMLLGSTMEALQQASGKLMRQGHENGTPSQQRMGQEQASPAGQ